jgi:hypothetical protein
MVSLPPTNTLIILAPWSQGANFHGPNLQTRARNHLFAIHEYICAVNGTEVISVMRKTPIQVGDRFVKTGASQAGVWVVSRIFQIPAEPQHANLTKEGNGRETLTISLPTLGDPHYFKRA